MSGNYQKTPIYSALTRHGRREIDAALQLTGKALPASITKMMGSIATIKFEVTGIPQTLPGVTVPIAGSEYIREPLQVGCKGVVFPADARLGPVSGLGGTSADLSTPGNLSALVFFPIGNKGFAAPEDPNQLEMYGIDGVLIKSTKNKEWFARWTASGVTISNNAGTASIAWNGAAWEFKGPVLFDSVVTMNAALQLAGNMLSASGGTYSGAIHTTGTITGDTDVVAAGKSGAHHVHGGVQTGGGSTAAPT
jgi:hypothetical protein